MKKGKGFENVHAIDRNWESLKQVFKRSHWESKRFQQSLYAI